MTGRPLKHEGVFADFHGGGYVTFERLRGFDPDAATFGWWMRHRTAVEGDPGWSRDTRSPSTSPNAMVVWSIDTRQDGDVETASLRLHDLTNLSLDGASAGHVRSGINVADGRWHHVAVSLQRAEPGHEVRLFWNGMLVVTKQVDYGPISDAPVLHIGGPFYDAPETGELFVGAIAQFRVVRRALSQEELRAGLLTELGTTDDVVLDLPLYCGDRQHPETRSLEDRLGRRAHQARLGWKALTWIDWDRTRAGDPDSLTDHPMASAYLREARLAHYDLRGSFEAADLIGARFERCDLKGASLAGAVRGTAPDHRTTLHNCTNVPVESFVVEADGKRFIDLRDLDLRGSELEGLPHDLTDLDARGAELSGIDLRDRQLRRARFDGAWLVSARLARIDAHAASFDKAHLGGANLTGAQLIQATFRGAWLDKDDDNTSATLAGSVMDRADFTGAHLYHADLSNVVLDSGILADTELLGVKLSGSDLCHADLGGATITGATFSRACLINAVFRGAVMGHAQSSTTTSFDSAMLQGADFTNATLRGVNLRNAVLATKPGHFLVTKRVRGRRIELKMEHGATILPAELTTHNVICPNGDRDDCTVTTWTIHDPPTSWKGE